MSGWKLEPAYSELAEDFGSLEAVFALKGERLTHDPLSEVIRVNRMASTITSNVTSARARACAVIWASRG